MSAAVAPPRFTMKLACLEDSPRRYAAYLEAALLDHRAATSRPGFFQTSRRGGASGWVDFLT